MGRLASAADAQRQLRLRIYNLDPGQARADVRGAQRTVHDYSGRWVLELLQNAEDAKASKVAIHHAPGDAVYFFDNSPAGLQPSAVEPLSSLDRSNKREGIGRKGLGFKAVYEISGTPEIYASAGDGVWDDGFHFSAQACVGILAEGSSQLKAVVEAEGLPYQWLPWPVPIDRPDLVQAALAASPGFRTCIRLPFLDKAAEEKAAKAIAEWSEFCLLAFRQLTEVRLTGRTTSSVHINRGEARSTLVKDGRTQVWEVRRSQVHAVPLEIAATLRPDDLARAVQSDIIVAAPLDDNGMVVALAKPPPLHVYYPTEHAAPVGFFLHADFAVKSDREHLVPCESHPYNAWLADQLAGEIVGFANAQLGANRDAHSGILRAFRKPVNPDSQTAILWQRVKARARHANDGLLVPTAAGQVTIANAKLFAPVVRPKIAENLSKNAPWWKNQVQPEVAQAAGVRAALQDLDVTPTTDRDVFDHISGSLPAWATEQGALWSVWQWASAISATESPHRLPVAEQPNQSAQGQFAALRDRLPALRLLPIGDELLSLKNLELRQLTIWLGQVNVTVPAWLPVRMLAETWAAAFEATNKDSLERAYAKKVGLTDDKVLLPALQRSIGAYWQDPSTISDPAQVFSFILALDGAAELKEEEWQSLGECPLPVRGTSKWNKAQAMALGAEFGHPLMDRIYHGTEMPFVGPIQGDADAVHSALEDLGCAVRPTLTKIEGPWNPGHHGKLLPEAQRHAHIRVPTATDWQWTNLVLEELATDAATALLTIVAQEWAYYQPKTNLTAYYAKLSTSSKSHYESSYNNAHWLIRLRSRLTPPQTGWLGARQKLENCWLPDGESMGALSDFAPAVDSVAFGDLWASVSGALMQCSAVPGSNPSRLPYELGRAISVGFTRWRELELDPRYYEQAMSLVKHYIDVVERTKTPVKAMHLPIKTAGQVRLVLARECCVTRKVEYADTFGQRTSFVRLRAGHIKPAVELLGVQDFDAQVQEHVEHDGIDDALTRKATARLEEVGPYWAAALATDDHRLNYDTAVERVDALTVQVVGNLRVRVETTRYGRAIIPRRTEGEESRLRVTSASDLDVGLSEAAADALGKVNRFDYLLNILRGDHDLRMQILSREEQKEHITAWLESYQRPAPPPRPVTVDTGNGATVPNPSAIPTKAPTVEAEAPADRERAKRGVVLGNEEPLATLEPEPPLEADQPEPGDHDHANHRRSLVGGEGWRNDIPPEEIEVLDPLAAPDAPLPRPRNAPRPRRITEGGDYQDSDPTPEQEAAWAAIGALGESRLAAWFTRQGFQFEWANVEGESNTSPDFVLHDGARRRLVEVKTVASKAAIVWLTGRQWELARENPEDFELWVLILHNEGRRITPIIHRDIVEAVATGRIRVHETGLRIQRNIVDA